MRSLIVAVASVFVVTACASHSPTPEKVAAAPAAAKAAPQCYSGDHGKFLDIGTQTAISGVEVVCQATSDGKGAQWMGVKAKH